MKLQRSLLIGLGLVFMVGGMACEPRHKESQVKPYRSSRENLDLRKQKTKDFEATLDSIEGQIEKVNTTQSAAASFIAETDVRDKTALRVMSEALSANKSLFAPVGDDGEYSRERKTILPGPEADSECARVTETTRIMTKKIQEEKREDEAVVRVEREVIDTVQVWITTCKTKEGPVLVGDFRVLETGFQLKLTLEPIQAILAYRLQQTIAATPSCQIESSEDDEFKSAECKDQVFAIAQDSVIVIDLARFKSEGNERFEVSGRVTDLAGAEIRKFSVTVDKDMQVSVQLDRDMKVTVTTPEATPTPTPAATPETTPTPLH